MASDRMVIAALGRPFTLGMLYDARREELIPGLTLWDAKTLQANTVKRPQHSSAFEITASDTIESKSSLLDVSSSLKASFLGGLIEVGGSAKFLSDTKKFKNQSRVTCQYKATTSFKQLSMIDLITMSTKQTEVIKKNKATHVVTGILYGASAFFVFDSDKMEASDVQDISSCMRAVIRKIPTLNEEGSINIHLNEEEKKLTNRFSCKFYGDFLLESNPATFADAVKIYVQLPKLLEEDRQDSVPLKVWMMPLKNLEPGADELATEVSFSLVKEVQDSLEDIKEIIMRCNDSLVDPVVRRFPLVQRQLRKFRGLCKEYASEVKKEMAQKLPALRAGEECELTVEQLLHSADQLVKKLNRWLDHKEREVNVIRSCVGATMKDVKIVLSQSELDREVLAPGVEDALCFVFTSLESSDPEEMASQSDSTDSGSNDDHWYYSDEVLMKMRDRAREFKNLTKALKGDSRVCFLIAAIDNKDYTGATVYHYKDGCLLSEDFSRPAPPPVETITDRRDLIWYTTDVTLDPDTANYYITLSEGDKMATKGAHQSYPDTAERFDSRHQVLCREPLAGRHYWEVEWSDGCLQCVYITAAYKSIGRKGSSDGTNFGHNLMSWCICHSGSVSVFHNGHCGEVSFPPTGGRRVGVYVDWPAGTLSFYSVSSNTLTHLHTYRTTFTEPLYPGFIVHHDGNYVDLRPAKPEL